MIDTAAAINTAGTGLLAENNAAAGPTMQVKATDLLLTYGRVNNANSSAPVRTHCDSPPLATPKHAARGISAMPAGLNPVELMIRGFGGPNAAKISGATVPRWTAASPPSAPAPRWPLPSLLSRLIKPPGSPHARGTQRYQRQWPL